MTCCEFDTNRCKEYERYLLCKYGHIRRTVIGATVCDREIVAYTVGADDGVLMCGAFHGMERVTAGLLYRFLDEVCSRAKSDPTLFKKLQTTGLTVVPMVNPDGVQISVHGAHTAGALKGHVTRVIEKAHTSHSRWQANARGVDINHNFDAGFKGVKKREKEMGILSPAPTRYGAQCPHSECETKALCRLCESHHYHLAVALHTQGREIYYDYAEHTPKDSLSIAQKLSQLSGYAVSHPQGIAVGGGFKDWFIKRFHRPAFTLELGLGKNPLPPDTLYSEYNVTSKMLCYLLNYGTKKLP